MLAFGKGREGELDHYITDENDAGEGKTGKAGREKERKGKKKEKMAIQKRLSYESEEYKDKGKETKQNNK